MEHAHDGDDCRGSRIGCFREHAGGTPAATELLWREGGDDFFEPRIAAKGIPERHQFQFAVAKVHTASGATDGSGKLFAGEIFFTNLSSNHRQILDHDHAIDWVLFDGKKLDRAASFAQGVLLLPESRIDYT